MTAPTPTPEALAEALEAEICDVLADGGALSPRQFARRLLDGPLAALRPENERLRAALDKAQQEASALREGIRHVARTARSVEETRRQHDEFMRRHPILVGGADV